MKEYLRLLPALLVGLCVATAEAQMPKLAVEFTAFRPSGVRTASANRSGCACGGFNRMRMV